MKTKNKYTVDYFIRKFKKIPTDRWCKFKIISNGRRCVLGHCGFSTKGVTEEGLALQLLINKYLHTSIANVNDNVLTGSFSTLEELEIIRDKRSIKDRVLSALYLVKNKMK